MRTFSAALTAGVAVVAAIAGYAFSTLQADRNETQPTENRPTAAASLDRCELKQEAYGDGMRQAESDAMAMKQYAATREMLPPSAKDFPALWNADLGVATVEEVSRWQDLKRTATHSIMVALQIVDDSPECFDPSLVADVRTRLN